MKPLRILWHSNAPFVSTGYGVQTKHALDILTDIQAEGGPIEEIAVSALYGLNCGRIELGGRVHYGNPRPGIDPWGMQVVEDWYRDFDANLLVTLFDAWVLDPKLGASTNWMPWFPVDHEPMPPGVLGPLQRSMFPTAMSKFGQQAANDVGLDVSYIPHCVDTDVFKPMDAAERRAARAWLDYGDDEFVFGMVANNSGTPSRKAFTEVMQGFQSVHEKHPNARLYIHANPRPGAIGVDLAQLSLTFGLTDVVSFTDPKVFNTHFNGDEPMVAMFNAFDVLVTPSYGEGFGVPIIEAQACGTPVLTQDCTAMTELTVGGICIPKGRAWMSQQAAYQWMPDPRDIAEAMEEMLGWDSSSMVAEGAVGRDFVVENYDIMEVRDKFWEPRVYELAEALETLTPVLEAVS